MKCTAAAKGTGKQCRRDAIIGGSVCIMHGGSAPQVRAAANRRILEFVNPALAQLAAVLEMPFDVDNPERTAAVKMRAIKQILDRAGITPPNHVDVVITDDMIERRIEEMLGEIERVDGAYPTQEG